LPPEDLVVRIKQKSSRAGIHFAGSKPLEYPATASLSKARPARSRHN